MRFGLGTEPKPRYRCEGYSAGARDRHCFITCFPTGFPGTECPQAPPAPLAPVTLLYKTNQAQIRQDKQLPYASGPRHRANELASLCMMYWTMYLAPNPTRREVAQNRLISCTVCGFREILRESRKTPRMMALVQTSTFGMCPSHTGLQRAPILYSRR